jgi:hypothetical protein
MQNNDRTHQAERAQPRPLDSVRMDKTVFSVFSSFEEADAADKEYWRTQSPQARLEALELMRQVAYGYDPLTARIERVLEVVKREPN